MPKNGVYWEYNVNGQIRKYYVFYIKGSKITSDDHWKIIVEKAKNQAIRFNCESVAIISTKTNASLGGIFLK